MVVVCVGEVVVCVYVVNDMMWLCSCIAYHVVFMVYTLMVMCFML